MLNFNVETHGDIRFGSICRRYAVMNGKLPAPRARTAYTRPFDSIKFIISHSRATESYATASSYTDASQGNQTPRSKCTVASGVAAAASGERRA